MLDNIFGISSQQNLGFSPVSVIVNLLVAFALSLILALVYKKTHRGLSYSQSFVLTLIISGMVIAAVMMVIGSNIARAFGAFGAFSLIRFRTAIKDSKDMAYMFLTLAVGMAVGSDNYIIALSVTIIASIVILVLTKINFGSIRHFNYILSFNLDTRTTQENVYKTLFDQHLKNSSILNIKAIEQGHVLMLSFSVGFINENKIQEFTSALDKIDGISSVNLITAKNDIEY